MPRQVRTLPVRVCRTRVECSSARARLCRVLCAVAQRGPDAAARRLWGHAHRRGRGHDHGHVRRTACLYTKAKPAHCMELPLRMPAPDGFAYYLTVPVQQAAALVAACCTGTCTGVWTPARECGRAGLHVEVQVFACALGPHPVRGNLISEHRLLHGRSSCTTAPLLCA